MKKELNRRAEVWLTDYVCGREGAGVSGRSPTECVGVMEWDGFERGAPVGEPTRPRFRHRCSKCASSDWLPIKYPLVEYERIDLAETPTHTSATPAPASK